ncbi:MAG TPA: nucleoside triphosphate pyrophosphohydrolase family protein [Candidatus Saccharimonadales bacterium]|nr:nucleoside triphosphate pyrophosphohydrolase family protein [Candidatus Saccharimonadales bacterium]
MNIDDFQKHALTSVAITDKGIPDLAHRTLGLTGEAGILANQLKKVIRDKDGQPDEADTAEAAKRLGDVLYYTAVLADYFGLTLSEVAQQNMDRSTAFKDQRQK